jgi:uncharacterized protein
MLSHVRSVLSSLLPYAIVLCLTFVALCAFLYFRQDSFLFYPRPNDPGLRSDMREYRIEVPGEGAVLEGWWTTNTAAPNAAVIVYFGGNAEDVLYFASTAPRLPVRHVLVANYRGFGQNPGRLSEALAYRDALALYDYAVEQPDVKASDVFVMGRSLGSGIATYVAAHRSVAGSILVTPYDSMVAVAGRHYPIFPVSWLLKHRFASDQRAPTIRSPALMLVAELDEVIPPAHAQRLYELWAGPKSIHVLPRVGHNDIENHPQYDALVSAFLTERASTIAPRN